MPMCFMFSPSMAHERTAWVRYMLAPETPDLAAYLGDTLPDGPIG